jgi:hypothetical protein
VLFEHCAFVGTKPFGFLFPDEEKSQAMSDTGFRTFVLGSDFRTAGARHSRQRPLQAALSHCCSAMLPRILRARSRPPGKAMWSQLGGSTAQTLMQAYCLSHEPGYAKRRGQLMLSLSARHLPRLGKMLSRAVYLSAPINPSCDSSRQCLWYKIC